ncbi:MAG: hypothetical protein DI537_26595 [Stutzerimonas stutzeri]|jgi:transposase|nr:MAG: hypothetical protein DI537_26595 [Stutzerimonas stutzeri]
MGSYAAFDVSDKMSHLWVVDETGDKRWQGACATDPAAMAQMLGRHAPGLVRVVLETGSLSAYLYHGLVERGVPAICICARHAKGVLSVRTNKSDPHDAEGLAQMARTGWYKAVRIELPPSEWSIDYDSLDQGRDDDACEEAQARGNHREAA